MNDVITWVTEFLTNPLLPGLEALIAIIATLSGAVVFVLYRRRRLPDQSSQDVRNEQSNLGAQGVFHDTVTIHHHHNIKAPEDARERQNRERILLRKVGGGYIFVHRMLLEYFAELEQKGG